MDKIHVTREQIANAQTVVQLNDYAGIDTDAATRRLADFLPVATKPSIPVWEQIANAQNQAIPDLLTAGETAERDNRDSLMRLVGDVQSRLHPKIDGIDSHPPIDDTFGPKPYQVEMALPVQPDSIPKLKALQAVAEVLQNPNPQNVSIIVSDDDHNNADAIDLSGYLEKQVPGRKLHRTVVEPEFVDPIHKYRPRGEVEIIKVLNLEGIKESEPTIYASPPLNMGPAPTSYPRIQSRPEERKSWLKKWFQRDD